MMAVATYSKQLSSLSLGENGEITETALIALIDSIGAHLQVLEISGCSMLTPTSVLLISERCPLLTATGIAFVDFPTEDNLLAAISNFKNMKSFGLWFCRVSDDVLFQIAEHMPLLQELAVAEWYTPAHSEVGVTRVVERMRNICENTVASDSPKLEDNI